MHNEQGLLFSDRSTPLRLHSNILSTAKELLDGWIDAMRCTFEPTQEFTYLRIGGYWSTYEHIYAQRRRWRAMQIISRATWILLFGYFDANNNLIAEPSHHRCSLLYFHFDRHLTDHWLNYRSFAISVRTGWPQRIPPPPSSSRWLLLLVHLASGAAAVVVG